MSVTITNAAAVGALALLRGINKESTETQEQVSSGYRIGSAADGASSWSYAAIMRSDSQNLQAVNDALGLASSRVDATYTAMNSAIDILGQIQAKLVSAAEPGVDRTKVNAEVADLKNQLQTVAQSASFAGQNWLVNADPAAPPQWSIIASFTRSPTGEYQAQTINVSSSDTIAIDMHNAQNGLFTKAITSSSGSSYYLLDAGSDVGATPVPPATTTSEVKLDGTTTDQQLKDMTDVVQSVLSSLTTTAASIGVTKSRIDSQVSYVSDLSDALDKGVGALVDTDMDEASARQTAIETQKQMAVEAISILNTSQSKILILLE